MLARLVLLFLLSASVLWAESNTTVSEQPAFEQSKEQNSTLELLEDYNSATTEGALQSERAGVDANITKEDDNSSDMISPTTKLDDVSNLDIVKEQRKQRKIERTEEKAAPADEPHALVDTIVVKGSVLQGNIDELTADSITFKLIYGEGSIRINYADVDALVTEHEYHIYFDGKETMGHITGIKDHAFLLIKHGEVEELVTISKIDRFIVSEEEDDSLENRWRNTVPYLRGNLDFGIEFESGTYEKHKFNIAGHVERKRTVNRTIFDIVYAFERRATIDEPMSLYKDELYSYLEQDYAFSKHDTMFGAIGYDFDVPRGVDNRIYPAIGYGYLLREGKRRWVQFKVGGGYVYETFIDDPTFNIAQDDLTNSYLSGFFGVNAEYEVREIPLVDRMYFGGNFFYMPGFKDIKHNWLLRYSLSAAIPLSKSLSLKTVMRQISDNNPSPSVGNNKLTVDFYFSLLF